MDTITGTIISLMATAIAGLFGFLVYLFKWVINRADKRIEALETREQSTLTIIAETMRPIPASLEKINASISELSVLMKVQQESRRS